MDEVKGLSPLCSTIFGSSVKLLWFLAGDRLPAFFVSVSPGSNPLGSVAQAAFR